MKTLCPLLLAGALLAPAVLHAAAFEGKVNFKMSSGRDQPQEIIYNIKGDKIRLEMPAQKAMGGLILDTTKRETSVMMDEQKMYMVMPMPDVAAQAQKAKDGDVKFENTGEKETILGYPAEKYISTYEGAKTELWLAEGLGTFMSFNNPMGGRGRGASPIPMPQGWDRALAGKELFPLRVVGHDKSGKENFRLEATAIDKTSLPDAIFSPPAGYQKFDMGGMMKGMMPGMGR